MSPALQQMIDDYAGKIPITTLSVYKAYETTCDSDAFTAEFGVIKSIQRLEKTKEALKEALLDGAVSVATAVPQSFSWYTGGVFNDPACGYGEDAVLEHAVTVIGWGVDALLGEYWMVKNSWSAKWGTEGIIYISTENDLCGILQEMVVAELAFNTEAISNVFGIVFGSIVVAAALVALILGIWTYVRKYRNA